MILCTLPFPEEMVGIYITPGVINGMVTFEVAVGTPPHQFAGSNQSVLVRPSHKPGGVTVTLAAEVVGEHGAISPSMRT